MGKIVKKTFIVAAIVLVVAIISAGVFLLINKKTNQPNLDEFAKCLKSKGVIFYGAFWCPHCKDQKNLFGSSQKYLPYLECSTSDGKGQLQVCAKQKIQSYPTWQFKNKSIEVGELSLQTLSQKSGCQLSK